MEFNSGFKGLITQAASGVVPSVVDLSWVTVGVRLSNSDDGPIGPKHVETNKQGL